MLDLFDLREIEWLQKKPYEMSHHADRKDPDSPLKYKRSRLLTSYAKL